MTEAASEPALRKQEMEVIFFAVGFAVSSSLLVVINKWAVKEFPYAATVTAMQFGVSALVAWLLGVTGVAEVDPLEQKKVLAFLPAVFLFYISVGTNMKLLEHANVDMFIVVRSLVPIFTLGLEMAYLKSPFPGMKTVGSLLVIVLGAIGFVMDTYGEQTQQAYAYAGIYLVAISIDMVLIKKVVTDVKLTRWGLVYYNNFLAVLMMPLMMLMTREFDKVEQDYYSGKLSALMKLSVVFPVALSCLFGLSISFFALNARKALTATAFTVLGVVCKFATVFVNTVVWDNHASARGIFCVCICLVGGILFQQIQGSAVMTPQKKEEPVSNNEDAESKAPAELPPSTNNPTGESRENSSRRSQSCQ